MSMSRSLIVLLVCIRFTAVSQPDSLKSGLISSEGEERLNSLLSLTKYYIEKSPDSCLKYGSQAVDLAVKLMDNGSEAIANKRIGYSLFLSGNSDEAAAFYEKAYRNYFDNKDYIGATEILNLFGNVYTKTGDFQKAANYLTLAEQACDTMMLNPELEKQVKKLLSIIYTNTGLLYLEIDSIDKPLSYFQKALDLATESNDRTRMAASYNNIGMVYVRKQDYDAAVKMYSKSLAVSISAKDARFEAKTLHNIANVFEKQNHIDSAIHYIKQAEKIYEGINDRSGLALVIKNIGRYRLQSGNYSEALEQIQRALKIFTEIGELQQIYSCNKLLSEIYENKNNKSLALSYFKQYIALKDSVTGMETRKQIAEIQTRYETIKKEKENIGLKSELQINRIKLSQKNTILIMVTSASVVILIFLTVITYLFRLKSKAYDDLVRQNLKSLEMEKLYEREIISLPDNVGQEESSPAGKFSGLGLRLLKFIIEEKPFLWADVNLEEFCRKLNTNRTYLSKVINDQFNQTFNDLICEYRIRTARDLLSDPASHHLSVEGIGQMSGFKSNSTFHKRFKNLVGVTPNEFREKALKIPIEDLTVLLTK